MTCVVDYTSPAPSAVCFRSPLFTWVTSLLLIYRPGRLSWPCWLTHSGQFTHKVVTYPSQAQDMESSPVKDQRSTAVLRRQLAVSNTRLKRIYHMDKDEKLLLRTSAYWDCIKMWLNTKNCVYVVEQTDWRIKLCVFVVYCIYTVSHKKHTKIVLVISSTKLNQFL